LDEGEDERLEIRLSEARKRAYSAAAGRRGLKLAAWIRAVLDRASKR
jgi:predicted DNA binding CopG/RHH family protein